ncbi:MAG TPA: hypothetical protein VF116_18845 [Ktedonobacterales bacterium]
MASEAVEAEARRLLRAAREDDTPAGRRLWGQTRSQVAQLLIVVVCAVVFFAWTWYVRTYMPLDDALATAFLYGFSLICAAILPLGMWSLLVGRSRKATLAVFVLRDSAAASDERMPAVIDQPAPLSAAELDAAHDSKLIRWLDKPRATWQKVASATVLLLWVVFVVPVFFVPDWHWVGPLAFLRPTFDLLLPLGPWSNLIALALIIPLVFGWRVSGRMVVTVDAHGLHWTTGWPRKHTIRIGWEEVRSFTRLEFRSRWLPKPHTTFVLDCGRAILSWGYDPIRRSNGDRPLLGSDGSLRPEARLLASIVVTRGAVALRQATPCAVVVLGEAGRYLAHEWARRLHMPPSAAVPSSPPGLAAAFRLLTPPTILRWTLVPLACLPAILYAVYIVVSLMPR